MVVAALGVAGSSAYATSPRGREVQALRDDKARLLRVNRKLSRELKPVIARRIEDAAFSLQRGLLGRDEHRLGGSRRLGFYVSSIGWEDKRDGREIFQTGLRDERFRAAIRFTVDDMGRDVRVLEPPARVATARVVARFKAAIIDAHKASRYHDQYTPLSPEHIEVTVEDGADGLYLRAKAPSRPGAKPTYEYPLEIYGDMAGDLWDKEPWY